MNCCVTKMEQISRPFSNITQQKNTTPQADRISGRMAAQKTPKFTKGKGESGAGKCSSATLDEFVKIYLAQSNL